MPIYPNQITITVTGPAMTGKSAITRLIADTLIENGVLVVNDEGVNVQELEDTPSGYFEHPSERAATIVKHQLSVVVNIVEEQSSRSVKQQTEDAL